MEGSGDQARFAAQLRAQGEDERTVEAFVRIAQRITSVAGGWAVRPKHVDEAMRRAETEGASAPQLANLKRVGDALVSFARTSLAPPSMPAPAPPPVIAPRCAGCGGGTFALKAADAASPMEKGFGSLGALTSFAMVRILGCFGAITLILVGSAVFALYRAVTCRAGCVSCGRLADRMELDADTRAELDSTRRKTFLGAAGLGVAAALAFAAWMSIAAAILRSPS